MDDYGRVAGVQGNSRTIGQKSQRMGQNLTLRDALKAFLSYPTIGKELGTKNKDSYIPCK